MFCQEEIKHFPMYFWVVRKGGCDCSLLCGRQFRNSFTRKYEVKYGYCNIYSQFSSSMRVKGLPFF